MPVTLVDRLPLPNLKVYTAGSVSLLSIAIYYALSATSDPNWRANVTQGRQEAMAEPGEIEAKLVMTPPPVVADNSTRNVSEQFVDVMTFMLQEPLCMWTLINLAYCSLAVFGFGVQRLVFGQLRVAEAQRVKDKFWNYVFYKFIFVFGVINVQYMDEVLLWCSWFTVVGFLHLLGQLCKDRYEYLSSSPNTGSWVHVRLACLLGLILTAATALLGAAAAWGLPAGRDTFAFMAAECILVLVAVLHVVARYILQLYECDVAGPVAYYTHLVFDSLSLIVELIHVLHMVVYSNMLVSMASLVLLMQLRHLLHELQARVRRHRLYTSLATHMSRNYPMASKEEVEKNQDNCAICWEPMKEARKLPCSHLFHNSCLCQWVQQDASCPTCRRALDGAAPAPAPAPASAPASAHPNHLFHFDGSRYVSWLPSFSVEVTRVRGELAPGAAMDNTAQQLQHMFPQYSLATLTADLARTASADLTLDNILEGRLAAPEPIPEPEPLPVQQQPTLLDVATSTIEPWTPPSSAYVLPTTSAAGTDTIERFDRGAGPDIISSEYLVEDDSSIKMLSVDGNFPEYAVPGAKQVRFEPYADNGGSIVAIAGEDYAVIGADTRLSTGFSIYTREQKKLFKLSDKTVLGATGCWCDTLTLTRLLQARMQMYEHDHNKSMTTPAVAQMLSTMLYYKRFFPYYVSNVLAGLDGEGKGCVYSYDPIGHCERSNYRAGGSAGAQLQPLLDNQIGLKNMQNVKEAPIPREKALALLKDVFISAAERDIYTGDCIYILIITANGIQEEKFELRKD